MIINIIHHVPTILSLKILIYTTAYKIILYQLFMIYDPKTRSLPHKYLWILRDKQQKISLTVDYDSIYIYVYTYMLLYYLFNFLLYCQYISHLSLYI